MLSMRSGFLVAMLMTLSCAAANAPVRPWSVLVETSGGITGKGTGSIRFDSDRHVEVTNIARKQCTSTAFEEEVARVDDVLASAHEERWKEAYLPKNQCCDRIEYALTLDVAGRQVQTRWMDGAENIPDDLAKLIEAVDAMRAHYARNCE